MSVDQIKKALQIGRVVERGVVFYTLSVDGKVRSKTWDLDVLLAEHSRLLDLLLRLKTSSGVVV